MANCLVCTGNCGDVCDSGNVPGSCRGLPKGKKSYTVIFNLIVKLLSY